VIFLYLKITEAAKIGIFYAKSVCANVSVYVRVRVCVCVWVWERYVNFKLDWFHSSSLKNHCSDWRLSYTKDNIFWEIQHSSFSCRSSLKTMLVTISQPLGPVPVTESKKIMVGPEKIRLGQLCWSYFWRFFVKWDQVFYKNIKLGPSTKKLESHCYKGKM
jgi:hypothetical protein